MTDESDDIVAEAEVQRMREEVQAAVALRMAGLPQRAPINPNLPLWAQSIVTDVLQQYHEGRGDEPSLEQLKTDVRKYARRAAWLFDEEIARQFRLRSVNDDETARDV